MHSSLSLVEPLKAVCFWALCSCRHTGYPSSCAEVYPLMAPHNPGQSPPALSQKGTSPPAHSSGKDTSQLHKIPFFCYPKGFCPELKKNVCSMPSCTGRPGRTLAGSSLSARPPPPHWDAPSQRRQGKLVSGLEKAWIIQLRCKVRRWISQRRRGGQAAPRYATTGMRARLIISSTSVSTSQSGS